MVLTGAAFFHKVNLPLLKHLDATLMLVFYFSVLSYSQLFDCPLTVLRLPVLLRDAAGH